MSLEKITDYVVGNQNPEGFDAVKEFILEKMRQDGVCLPTREEVFRRLEELGKNSSLHEQIPSKELLLKINNETERDDSFYEKIIEERISGELQSVFKDLWSKKPSFVKEFFNENIG